MSIGGPSPGDDAAFEPGAVTWRERRALFVLALVAAGLLIGRSDLLTGLPAWGAMATAAALGVGSVFLRGGWCKALLGVAVVAVSLGWFRARCDESPHGSLAVLLREEPALIRVEGVALETPVFDPPESDPLDPDAPRSASPWRFELRAEALVDGAGARTPTSGVLRVRSGFRPEAVGAGTRVVARGFARGPVSAMNPGEPDRLRLARQEGIAGSLQVPAPEFIEAAGGAPGMSGSLRGGWLVVMERMRAAALRSLAARPGETAANPEREEAVALLRAMLLGHREDDLRDLSGAFTRIGLAHVLSVSGMNLTLLAGFALYAVRLVGDRPRLEKIAVGALLAACLVVVPAEAPIVRAALMIGVFLVAEWGGRRYDRINTLAWAAVLSLLWRPMDLWSAGFQLSYVGVASLIVLAGPVRERLFGRRPERDAMGAGLRGVLLRLLEGLKTGVSVSLCTWLATAPLVLYHTGVVSVIGPLANLAVWPLVTAITGAGYALVLVGALAPGATAWVTPALHVVAEALAWLVRLLDRVLGSAVHLPLVSAAWCAAAMAAVAWWALRPRPPLPSKAERRRGALLTAGVWGAAVLWLFAEVRLRPGVGADEVEVAVLHLPGGSCAVVRSGRGAMLYDAGAPWAGAGRRLIPRALRAMGVASARTVVISHADAGRFNALPELVRPLGVREALVGEQFIRFADDRPDGPAGRLIARLHELGVRVRAVAAGEVIEVGPARAVVLAPEPGRLMRTHRDASLVLGVEMPTPRSAGAATALAAVLLGDVGRDGFEALHARSPSLPAAVLLAPRGGWAANRVDELARWASDGAATPVVIQPDAEGAPSVAGLRSVSTRAGGCIRAVVRAGGQDEGLGEGRDSVRAGNRVALTLFRTDPGQPAATTPSPPAAPAGPSPSP